MISSRLVAGLVVLFTLAACSSKETAGGTGGAAGQASGGSAGTSTSSADLSCAGSVVLQPVGASSAPFSAQLIDGVSKTPIARAQLKSCPKGNSSCATTASDPQGEISISIPFDKYGFDGHFEASAAGYLPALYMATPPFVPQAGKLYQFWLYPTQALPSLYSAAGIQQDPAKGMLAVHVNDCAGVPADGIVVSLPAGAAGAFGYWRGGMVDSNATATDSSGVADAFNVTPGTVTVTATASGKLVAKADATVRAGVTTHILLGPTP